MSKLQYSKLGEIADVNWGDTSVTKASYVPNGYPAYSATGCDGFLPYADFDREAIVLSAIGARAGKTWFVDGKWSCIKNTIDSGAHLARLITAICTGQQQMKIFGQSAEQHNRLLRSETLVSC